MALVALAAALAVALVAAGCGSSSKKATLTKAQFVAKANAICTQGSQTLASDNKAFEKTFGKKGPSRAQITSYVTGVLAPSIQGQINGIRALGTPAGEQGTVTKMLDLAQADLNRLKSNPANPSGQFASFAKLAHPYGLTACAARS